MQQILTAIQRQGVDVVVYVDRLDGYRISKADQRVSRMQTLTLQYLCQGMHFGSPAVLTEP